MNYRVHLKSGKTFFITEGEYEYIVALIKEANGDVDYKFFIGDAVLLSLGSIEAIDKTPISAVPNLIPYYPPPQAPDSVNIPFVPRPPLLPPEPDHWLKTGSAGTDPTCQPTY